MELCIDLLHRASVEGEDDQEETILNLEGWFRFTDMPELKGQLLTTLTADPSPNLPPPHKEASKFGQRASICSTLLIFMQHIPCCISE